MKIAVPVLIAALALSLGCGKKSSATSESSDDSIPVAPATPASTNKVDYAVFPDADAAADASVPAEQGGKGFDGKGWETNSDFDFIGDPRALKGGTLHDSIPDFPNTLRTEGPESNTIFNQEVLGGTVYETLLGTHPTTLQYMPSLATHWQISPDKLTYRFRINPNAKFSDGTPVTADDVVASWDFRMDKTLQAPINQVLYGKVNRPVAESKYIVRVVSKEVNWRNFLTFSGMFIFPARVLKTLTGDTYLKTFNDKLLPGTGPYTLSDDDVKKGQSITFRRRKDYWAEKARANVGLNNFDTLNFVVVRDENLQFEMLKKGQLDVFYVSRAKQWVEELNFDNIQRGLVQKRKAFNQAAQAVEGLAFNTRRAPFDDIRVRKALTLLLNRKELIAKIMNNQYEPENSYFSDSPYENPSDPKNEYDPQQALKLLADAGWNSHDSQGRLVKNGMPLEIELLYDTKLFEPHLTVYQEDLRKVGINLNLRLITPETTYQMVSDRKFQMTLMAWSGGTSPEPESNWLSTLADVPNTDNITGFKNARVDELCKQYAQQFDLTKRIPIIRELDGILTNAYQYVLLWNAPYVRVVYWNKYGTPPGYVTRTGDYYSIYTMWWIDPAKYASLKEAQRDPSKKLDVGESDDHYWDEYSKTHPMAQ